MDPDSRTKKQQAGRAGDYHTAEVAALWPTYRRLYNRVIP